LNYSRSKLLSQSMTWLSWFFRSNKINKSLIRLFSFIDPYRGFQSGHNHQRPFPGQNYGQHQQQYGNNQFQVPIAGPSGNVKIPPVQPVNIQHINPTQPGNNQQQIPVQSGNIQPQKVPTQSGNNHSTGISSKYKPIICLFDSRRLKKDFFTSSPP